MRRISPALLGLLLFLLAGCGTPAEEARPVTAVDVVAAAASKTAEAHTAKIFVSTGQRDAPEGKLETGKGVVDFSRRRLHLVLDAGAPGRTAGLPGLVEVLVDGRATYLKVPDGMAAPTPWYRVGLEEGGGLLPLSDLPQISNDPVPGLAYLGAVTGNVEEVGSDRVRGVATTHYRAVIQVDDVLAQAPSKDRAVLRQYLTMLGMKQLPMDVWVDVDGLLRRQVTIIDLGQNNLLDSPKAPEILNTVEFCDFGAEVDITPPPADQVMTLKDMLRRSSRPGPPAAGGTPG